MPTNTICQIAEALRAFLTEREYQARTQERIELLESIGISLASDDLLSTL